MSINVAILSDQSILIFKFLWRILADSVGLPGVGLDAYVRVEGSAFDDKLEHVPFFHELQDNKIK